MRTCYWRLIAILAIVCPQVAEAALQSPIAPGDIIFAERFRGWQKLDPATGQISEITPWNEAVRPGPSTFAKSISFDVDGAILYSSSTDIFRLNPWTGEITSVLTFPEPSTAGGFVVESNGDLLLADPEEGILRFSRATQTTTKVVPIRRGSLPSGIDRITRTSEGRVFVAGGSPKVFELDLQAGTASNLVTTNQTQVQRIVSHPDGRVLIRAGLPSEVLLVDPDTGNAQVFSDQMDTFLEDEFAFDETGNLWQSIDLPSGIYKYPSTGGNPTLYTTGSIFNPGAITVVPLNWSPPPVPEPSGIALVTFTALGLFARRRVPQTSRPPTRPLS
jgi:streptogramin lyase